MLSRAKRLPRYAALIAFVLALAACGGGGSGSSSDAGGGSDSGSSTDSGGSGGSGGSGDAGSGDSPELESNSTDGQVKLEWSQQDKANAYNLYYATEGDIDPANFQIWINDHNGEEVAGITDSSYTVEGLEAGTEYHFAVTPVVDGQEGDKSNEVSVTPEDSGDRVSTLNDTGITYCFDGEPGNYNAHVEECPVEGYPNQDGDVGRDAAAAAGELDKEGIGARGLDYTKIDADGNELPDGADDWACVRDNHTGLMWEVKRPDRGFRGVDSRYSWYDPDDPTNGDGVSNAGEACGGISCDTHHYVQAINDRELCGVSDWRMPSVNELHSLAYRAGGSATFPMKVDDGLFPTDPTFFGQWTSSPSAANRDAAWDVNLYNGTDDNPGAGNRRACSSGQRIRLVREVDNTAESTAPAMASASSEMPSAADNCAGNLPPRSPSSEFTAVEGGSVVHHQPTGLEWQRCPAGMEWNGDTCSGSAKTMDWQAALQYAAERDGWRLPNINELRSIVERCRTGPAVNQAVFPETGSVQYYSSSPARRAARTDLYKMGGVWTVDFEQGTSRMTRDPDKEDLIGSSRGCPEEFPCPPFAKELPHRVRLVRTPQ